MRGNGASLFLGENGSLYGTEEQRVFAPVSLQDPEKTGWIDAGSGYFRNSIFGLNRR